MVGMELDMGLMHYRYQKQSLDIYCAMQHDAHVSSIFLQEVRFSPPLGGYFLVLRGEWGKTGLTN